MEVGIKVGNMTVNVTATDKNQAIIAKKEFTAEDLFDVAKLDGDASSITAEELQQAGFHPTEANFGAVLGEMNRMRSTLRPRETTVITTMTQAAAGQELVAQERAFTNVYGQMRQQRTNEANALGNELSATRIPNGPNVLQAASAAPGSANGIKFQQYLQGLPADQRTALVAKLKEFAIKSTQRDATALSIMVNVGETPQAGQAELNTGRQRFMDAVNTEASRQYHAQGGRAQYMALAFHATGDGSNTSADFKGSGGNYQHVELGDLQYSEQTNLKSVTNADNRSEHREALASGNLKPVLDGANQATFRLPNVDPHSDSPVVLGVGGNDGAGVKVTVKYGEHEIHLVGGSSLRPDENFQMPPGFRFDRNNQILIPPQGVTPGDAGITVTMASNKFENNHTIEGQSDNPFDEMFIVTRTLQVITPQTTVEPVPTLPQLPDPHPATDGVGGFDPNHIELLAGSEVDKNVDAMAAYVAKHPDVLTDMTISLSSLGATHNGTMVNEDDYKNKTYGAVVNGEKLTEEATASDRKSSFSMVLKDGKFAIVGQGSADPFAAKIQGVDRGKLEAFMKQHPKLKENDVLGALRQFALLEAFQTKLNEQLTAQGKPNVSLLANASVALERDGTKMSFAEYQAITGK